MSAKHNRTSNEEEILMKLIIVSLIGRTDVSYDDVSGYEVTDNGELDIRDQEDRTIATWARGSWAVVDRNLEGDEDWTTFNEDDISSIYVSPPVLDEIKQYVRGLEENDRPDLHTISDARQQQSVFSLLGAGFTVLG
jgi:hypothetical protein